MELSSSPVQNNTNFVALPRLRRLRHDEHKVKQLRSVDNSYRVPVLMMWDEIWVYSFPHSQEDMLNKVVYTALKTVFRNQLVSQTQSKLVKLCSILLRVNIPVGLATTTFSLACNLWHSIIIPTRVLWKFNPLFSAALRILSLKGFLEISLTSCVNP